MAAKSSDTFPPPLPTKDLKEDDDGDPLKTTGVADRSPRGGEGESSTNLGASSASSVTQSPPTSSSFRLRRGTGWNKVSPHSSTDASPSSSSASEGESEGEESSENLFPARAGVVPSVKSVSEPGPQDVGAAVGTHETEAITPHDEDEGEDDYNKSWKITLVARNFFKLKTKEDFNHLHKILGIACFAHYIYRFLSLLLTGSMGFERNPRVVMLGFIALHAALSWSSFIFRIPTRRIKSKPMIWPELRLHNCVFATRSLLDMAIHAMGWGMVGYGAGRPLVAFLAMFAADAVTDHYKRLALLEGGDSTMRGMPWPPGARPELISLANAYYAMSQLFATAGVINISRSWRTDVELAFATLFAIQISALLLTLVRKSIMQPFGWHFWYAASLALSWVLATVRYAESAGYASVMARTAVGVPLLYALRFKLDMNKYLLWTLFTLLDGLALRSSTARTSSGYGYEDHPFVA